MSEPMDKAVVEVKDLHRDFGNKKALNNVSFQVQPGTVFGLVGENGAGKTTLIKHMLGLYSAQSGGVNMFGYNPVTHPQEVLSRIGYLSEEPDLPGWMTINEYFNYSKAFYPNWDQSYADQLMKMFELPQKRKLKNLSKGQRARVGLVAAQAHRPELLLLDEPSSGLDPIVRRDILSAVIRTVVEEGRTVIFSSHLMDEVERVSDVVTMISAGHLVLSGSMEDVLADHHRVYLPVGGFVEKPTQLQTVVRAEQQGSEWALSCRGQWDAIQAEIEDAGGRVASHDGLSLDEIFVMHSGFKATQEGEV